jgi:4-hydroxy-2-oxoheptanedioate aldolase
MIETREGAANLTGILDVPGVACRRPGSRARRGPASVPARTRNRDRRRIIAETKRRSQYAGIHCASTAYAAQAIDMGFRLVTILNDSALAQAANRGGDTDSAGKSRHRRSSPVIAAFGCRQPLARLSQLE